MFVFSFLRINNFIINSELNYCPNILNFEWKIIKIDIRLGRTNERPTTDSRLADIRFLTAEYWTNRIF